MAGDGGRRGYISHTAVSSAYQRQGIGNGQRGSFYVLIIETSKTAKIYCAMQRFTGFIAGNVIYYNVDSYNIGFN